MNKFKFTTTPIEGLFIIEPTLFADSRGYFMETYNHQDFLPYINATFVQDNQSKSQKGVLRGLHYQAKNPQGKLVRVLEGEVFDVAVDLRPNSPTYSQHYSIILSAQNNLQFYIPEGFAHGFLVLSDTATFTYKCTAPYDPQDQHGILYNDPTLTIPWPTLPNLTLSDKDTNLPLFINHVIGN